MGFGLGSLVGAATGGFIGTVAGGYADGAGGGGGLPGRAGYDPERQRLIGKRIDDLRDQLKGIPAAKPLGPEGATYQAKQYQPGPEFAAERSRVSNQVNAASQTAQDALARRYAAMGGQNGGAFIKQQQQLLSDTADKRAEAMAQVDQKEQALKHEFDQQEAGKEFQSAEAGKARGLQRETYNSDLDFKDKVFRFDSNSKLAQMQLSFEQADRDAQDQEFNKEMALYQARHTGGLLGAGGFLGSGIGA